MAQQKKSPGATNALPLTVANAHIWKLDLLQLLEGPDPVTVDLSKIEDCDTAGIQLLLAAQTTAKEKGKSLLLGAPGPSVSEAAARMGLPLSETFQTTE